MSDSDSGPEIVEYDDFGGGAQLIYEKDSPFAALHPPAEIIYERLRKVPIGVKKQAAHLLNVNAFWYHILLLRQESHRTTRWAVQVGFIDSNVSIDLSLKRLSSIEILEAILRAMEEGSFEENQTRRMIWISNRFNLEFPGVLEEALDWLEETREPLIRQKIQELGSRRILYTALQHVFTEYAHYIQAMGVNRKKLMRELSASPSPWAIEKSEEMKSKGNDLFQKKKYDAALKYYTKAIKFYPENHVVYGNRALCNIRCEKYLKALGDGKRAMLLKPTWAKGHYRFSEALYYLGEHKRAIEANALAQTICSDDPEGIRDLQAQYLKYSSEIEESQLQAAAALSKKSQVKTTIKRPDSATRTPRTEPPAGTSTTHPAPPIRTAEAKTSSLDHSRKTKAVTPGVGSVPKWTELKRETADKSSTKPVLKAPENNKTRKNEDHSKDQMNTELSKDKLRESLRASVLDAHVALSDQRSRNAETAFSLALCLLETSTPKDLGISSLDVVVLIYGRASALTEIGQPEELAEALREYERIQSYEQRKFQCLVYYGIGKVYLKENRFSKALAQFTDSLQMVKNQITPGKLTWPTTKETIKETQPDYFKELLWKAIERCRFHPRPDAVCCHINCHGHSKVEIYFTDPDFKGFIQISCCQRCIIEYHIICWKNFKAASFADRNEKDFLQEMCFTPDCGGRICCIKIYDSSGLIKCKFEAPVIKPIGPIKAREKQPCTNLRKIAAKENRKLRRRQRRQETSQLNRVQSRQDVLENRKSPVAQSKPNASSPDWLLYGDRVLIQMSESRALFEEERSADVPALMKTLRPWVELDFLKGNAVASRLLSQRPQPGSLGQVVELLLERRNRVWARVVVHFLSSSTGSSLDGISKLCDWAHQLDHTGLSAAGTFLDRHAEHLEELDLAPLLAFAPFQDLLVEKFGVMPEAFFSHGGLSVTEYLKQAAPHEVRLFIWTLEEHRDIGETFASCRNILDEYFEMMDGVCLVIRKPEYEYDDISHNKNKTRNRKKKQKETMSIVSLSGRRRGAHRENDDQDFIDDQDSLTLPQSPDPFTVPNHLRNRVAQFEDQYQYNNGGLDLQYKTILENTADPVKESLYVYFAQILESNGPLEFEDPLLVGELDNFPAVSRKKLEEAGGLGPFLLESLRFVLIGQRVGLPSQSLTQSSGGLDSLDLIGADRPDLDPAAPGFVPGNRDAPQDVDRLQDGVFPPPGYAPSSSSPQPAGVYFPLPCPYVYGPQEPHVLLGCPIILPPPFVDWSECTQPRGAAAFSNHAPFEAANADPYDSGKEEEGLVVAKAVQSPRGLPKVNAAVQVSWILNGGVAVNTEPYEGFETNNGDLTKKEKSDSEFEKQIHQMEADHGATVQRRRESIAALTEELEDITGSIQDTNKELVALQQRLEEEVLKDQQEKKENQETLRSLKTEIKELSVTQEELNKSIVEKNNEYQKRLHEFSGLREQSEAERMSVEDEMKRCKDLCAKATRRSQAAELAILESYRVQGLRGLSRFLADGKAILAKLEELAPRYPPQILYLPLESWRACVKDAQEKVDATESQYHKQMDLVKKGSLLSSLAPVPVPNTPMAPPIPPLHMLPPGPPPPPLLFQAPPPPLSFAPPEFRGPLPGPPRAPTPQSPVPAQRTRRTPTPPTTTTTVPAGAPAGAIAVRQRGPAQKPVQAHHHSHAPAAAPRPPAPKNDTVFERILDRLSTLFPNHTRPVLMKLVQDVRVSNGGALNSLGYEDVVNQAAQIILDQQDSGLRDQMTPARAGPPGAFGVQGQYGGASPRSASPASARSTGTPPPGQAWRSVGAQGRPQSKALNMEDPCIICHEDMSPEDLCVLECRHSFHRECIRSWLREQSTCPTCREHALLPEDFPMLPGRTRRGPTPSALS